MRLIFAFQLIPLTFSAIILPIMISPHFALYCLLFYSSSSCQVPYFGSPMWQTMHCNGPAWFHCIGVELWQAVLLHVPALYTGVVLVWSCDTVGVSCLYPFDRVQLSSNVGTVAILSLSWAFVFRFSGALNVTSTAPLICTVLVGSTIMLPFAEAPL